MRLALGAMGFVGVAVFGLILAVTYLSPIQIERAARGFIQNQIEQQISDVIGGARETRIGRFAEVIAAQHSDEIALLQDQLATGLNAEIAVAVGRLQDIDCECRGRMLQTLDAASALRISPLERAEPQLRRLIEGSYGEIVSGLLGDLRIFAGINLIAFGLLAALSIMRPDRVRQLVVPGILLGLAAVTASAFYLLGQNWFFTILYADYMGWAYGLWLLLVFGFFFDIVVLRARTTTRIVDAVAGVATAPC